MDSNRIRSLAPFAGTAAPNALLGSGYREPQPSDSLNRYRRRFVDSATLLSPGGFGAGYVIAAPSRSRARFRRSALPGAIRGAFVSAPVRDTLRT